jgi:hypothetical protein
MMSLIACKHLDHNAENYPTCELIEPEQFPGVKYFKRLNPGEGNPVNVQFCGKGRGRINSIFDCYDGCLSCYESAIAAAKGE